MNAVTSAVEKAANAALKRWIHRKIVNATIHCMVSGTIFCALGLMTIALSSVLVAFVSLMLLFRVVAVFSLIGTPIHLQPRPILFSVVLCITLLSFVEAWRNPYGLGSFRHAVHLQDRVSGAMLGSLGSVIADLFLAGPRMALSGVDSFLETSRLLRTNLDDAAAVLLWMLKRNRKVAVEELVSAFPELNFVRLLPQLRLLRGFIWLPTRNGVCILSSELKSEVRALPHLAFETFEEPEASIPFHNLPLPDEQRWFAILGLQTYASLAEVKTRYRTLARQFHPDRHRTADMDAQKAAEERMKEINAAYRSICQRFAEA